MLKKIVLATILIAFPITANSDSVSINKDGKTSTRVETRSYWEFREDDNPRKAGWKLKKDRIYVTEPSDKESKKEK